LIDPFGQLWAFSVKRNRSLGNSLLADIERCKYRRLLWLCAHLLDFDRVYGLWFNKNSRFTFWLYGRKLTLVISLSH